MRWNYLSILKLQRCSHLKFENELVISFVLDCICDYLSMLEFHVDQRRPALHPAHRRWWYNMKFSSSKIHSDVTWATGLTVLPPRKIYAETGVIIYRSNHVYIWWQISWQSNLKLAPGVISCITGLSIDLDNHIVVKKNYTKKLGAILYETTMMYYKLWQK